MTSGNYYDVSLPSALSNVPRFSAFQESINIPNSTSNILQQELFEINQLIDDIHEFLHNLHFIFNTKILSHDATRIEWFYDGKQNLMELIKDSENIDSVLFQLLGVIDRASLKVPPSQLDILLNKFELTSDLVLDVKNAYISFMKKIDLAINYKEITENIIKSLRTEVKACAETFRKISELKLSSPKRHLPKFDLMKVTSRMKINDLSSTTSPVSNFSMKSIRLPTFCEHDEQLYQEYLLLDEKVKPLKVSLEFLPIKVDEFIQTSRGIFPHAASQIKEIYDNLIESWTHLTIELGILKKESLDTRWNEIFKYLITEITDKCTSLHNELKNKSEDNSHDDTYDAIGPIYKLCSNSITMISKAFAEGTVSDPDLITDFNEILLPKWQTLNNTLLKSSSSLSLPSSQTKKYSESIPILDHSLDEKGLKTFRTVKQRTSFTSKAERSRNVATPSDSLTTISENFSPENNELQAATLRSKASPTSGLSIDIGLNVDQAFTTSPFSIEQKDKVKDFFPKIQEQDHLDLRRRNLKQSLMKLNGEDDATEDEDDEATLVHATPKFPFEFDPAFTDRRSTMIKTLYSKQELFAYLLSNNSQRSTKLPLIKENFGCLGLPVLKKRVFVGAKPTKLPSISPNHPVFYSPIRRQSNHEAKTLSTSANKPIHLIYQDNDSQNPQKTLKPPLFLLKRNSLLCLGNQTSIIQQPQIKQVLGDSTNKSSFKKHSAVNCNYPNDKFTNKDRSSISLSRLSSITLTDTNTPNLSFAAHVNHFPESERSRPLSLYSQVSPSTSIVSPSTSIRSKSSTRSIPSSSPERPNSSIGSRFDEVHLVQPIKNTRPGWK